MSVAAVTVEVAGPPTSELRRLESRQMVQHYNFPMPNLLGEWPVCQEYQYRELQHGEDIRLLKIIFKSRTQEISYELVHKRLFEVSGQFVAISYRWGILKPDRSIPMTNPGSSLAVTRVVKAMLEHIIGDLDVQYLWIDAICINQVDAEEKSSQVSMMGQIFSSAKSVRVWLGSAAQVDQQESFVWFWLRTILRADIQKSLLAIKRFDETDKYLRLMLGSEWFQRVWVIQEVCLAREVFFHFGKIVISFGQLHQVVQVRLRYPHTSALVDTQRRSDLPHDSLLASFVIMQEINTIRTYIKDRREGLRNLSDVYASFADQRATDPRDNIYALLGLIYPQGIGGITPDYLSDTASTYIDATVRMINVQSQLSVLGFAGLTRGTSGVRSTRNLPTWVPDFSTPPTADVWSQCKAFKACSIMMLQPIRFFLMPRFHRCFTLDDKRLIRRASVSDPFSGNSEYFGCISFSTAIVDEISGVAIWPQTFTTSGARSMAMINITAVDLLDDFKAFIASLMVLQGMSVSKRRVGRLSDPLWPAEDDIERYTQRMQEGYRNRFAESFARSGAGHCRRVFWTKEGHMGLAADGIQQGDLICLSPGSRVPLLLRGPVATFSSGTEIRHYYHLVCEAYIHGFMLGELMIYGTPSYQTLYII
ncbi:heterokaryon incompatibility protein-domain-containing protein [Xylariales sp. AK1849]|nr:heterokaryon incompatibility protein-domain-containing protein [Xylariales sp. AK1849]